MNQLPLGVLLCRDLKEKIFLSILAIDLELIVLFDLCLKCFLLLSLATLVVSKSGVMKRLPKLKLFSEGIMCFISSDLFYYY